MNPNNSRQGDPLRFAMLIRVSTERQETEGESLNTQKSDNGHSIEALKGALTRVYGGQEHATPGHERRELDRLLSDAADPRRDFNAVIVSHADRWSRDNAKNREGLEIFRAHGIRFFVGVTEFNLFSPEHCLFLEMSAVLGNFQARQQNLKSIKSRIHRAKSGVPTCGKLPFGRLQDPKTGLLYVDEAKQRIIQDAATRYLAGQRLPEIAGEYGMNHSNLHKVLTQRSGMDWQIEFRSATANVHEIVSIQIPPLLDEETIKAVRARAEANRTYSHGQRRSGHKYLLSRMILCAHCGYAMFGQTNHDCRRYYRHAHAKRERLCSGPAEKSWIKAGMIEDAVLRHLFSCFGNPAAVQRAIEEATPNRDKIEIVARQIERLNAAIEKTKKARTKMFRLVQEDAVTVETAKPELKRLDAEEERALATRKQLEQSVAHIPTSESIRDVSAKIVRRMQNVRVAAKIDMANQQFDSMSWGDKRELLQLVFGGKQRDGGRMGVYVEWVGGDGEWKYSIHGQLIDAEGWRPMTGGETEEQSETGGVEIRQRELVTKSASS